MPQFIEILKLASGAYLSAVLSVNKTCCSINTFHIIFVHDYFSLFFQVQMPRDKVLPNSCNCYISLHLGPRSTYSISIVFCLRFESVPSAGMSKRHLATQPAQFKKWKIAFKLLISKRREGAKNKKNCLLKRL